MTDEQRLLATLARMPSTPESTLAMARVLRGRSKPGDNALLRNREAEAVRHLEQSAETDVERLKWNGWYQRLTGLVK